MIKKSAKVVVSKIKPLLNLILLCFFEKRFLRSKHFSSGIVGYKWAFATIWQRNILCLASPLPFPASRNCFVSNWKNISFHPDDLNNFQSFGTYFQNMHGKIVLGRGSYVAPNVGIITANHQPGSLENHMPAKDVVIGDRCWIGMNSVILPGVQLANDTIVAAGSVVTKSFLQGNCVIGGNPAKMLKNYGIDKYSKVEK